MQQQTKNEVVKAKVVCAKEDIKANTFIAKDDIDKFFEEKEVEANILSKNVYKEIKDLSANGFYVESDVEALQMLYSNEICKTDEVMDKYVEGAYDNSSNALTPEYEAENGVGTAVVFSVKVAPDEIEAMNANS